MSYLSRETAPKEKTGEGEIARGSIRLEHLHSSLFLELQKIALHTHQGASSSTLPPVATPYVVRGFVPSERVERGVATWSGGAANSGGFTVYFDTAFESAPTIVATLSNASDAYYRYTIDNVSTTSFMFRWNDTLGTSSNIEINYMAIGR
jgi:hypothetical protein